jgi:hypothetical protein
LRWGGECSDFSGFCPCLVWLQPATPNNPSAAVLRRWFSWPAGAGTMEVREHRKKLGVVPSMKRVDTCAAEFEAGTPYMYSAYDGDCECEPTTARKVLILGAGPNRIGQGIEFDYCCCHASFALR